MHVFDWDVSQIRPLRYLEPSCLAAVIVMLTYQPHGLGIKSIYYARNSAWDGMGMLQTA